MSTPSFGLPRTWPACKPAVVARANPLAAARVPEEEIEALLRTEFPGLPDRAYGNIANQAVAAVAKRHAFAPATPASEARLGRAVNQSAVLSAPQTGYGAPSGSAGGRAPPATNGHGPPAADEETASESPDDEPETQDRQPKRRYTNWFRVPDRVRFELLHKDTGLGEAELRVYLFLVAQTVGSGKDEDRASLQQIRDGITKRNGVLWNVGTGLATRTIIRALQNLVERKLITITQNSDAAHGNVANTYTLILEEAPEEP